METPVDKIKSLNKDFKENEESIWRDRFTFKRDLKYAMASVDLSTFETETRTFKSLEPKLTIKDFLHTLESLSNKYIEWVKKKCPDIKNDKELLDEMCRWFKGTLGEYLYSCIFDEIKSLNVSLDGDKNVTQITFDYVTPIKGDDDHGVDFVGLANDTPIVIQIKTHHDWKKVADMSWYIKAYGEGCANNYINQHDEYNTYLCWFTNESNGLQSISKNKGFKKKSVCIGYETLSLCIDKKNTNFWIKFYESLAYLGN